MADQLQMFPFCSSGFDEHSTALMRSFHLFPSIWGKWPEGFEEQRITYNGMRSQSWVAKTGRIFGLSSGS
jgi:hypothetical protein